MPHTRPVINGAPAKEFRLDCQGCENFLRADIARSGGSKKIRTINGDTGLALKERYLGLWGATPDTTPESPDDELKREHDESAMITKNAASQTQTLADIGEAVKGNADLMAKFIELQIALAKQNTPPTAVPAPVADSVPLAGVNRYTADEAPCRDCGTAIRREPGQKGSLPWRCPDCKTSRRKAA
jgi:hypothetical protein